MPEDEGLIKRAVDQGIVTAEQLAEARGIQRHIQEAGIREELSAILIKKGWLTPEQLAQLREGSGPGSESGSSRPMIQGYEVLERVGRGGMGSVYKARRQSDGQIVAIKTLLPSYSQEKDVVDRFLREARVLQKLHHPSIVAAIDAGYQNEVYYLVMEFIEGDNLDRVVQSRKRLPWEVALKIVKSVAFALEHASRWGIIHRDIKPANLLMTKGGQVKITDLGLAKMVEGGTDASITQSGFVLGTPGFMSPEQVQGESEIDVRSDIYSLGVTLYYALSGRKPFDDPNPLVVLQKRLSQDVPFGELKKLGVPGAVLAIGRRMTMRKREDRYQSPEALLEDVMMLEAGERPQASRSDKPMDLFGKIAVANAFVTQEQLERCLTHQEALLQRGVKKPLGEVMLDQGAISRQQLKKILVVQSFNTRRSDENRLAQMIVGAGLATKEQVKAAREEQKRVFMQKGSAQPLVQILQARGVIDETKRRMILRMQRGEEQGDMGNTLIGVKECPKCMSVIPFRAKRCPSCEATVREPGVNVVCAACGQMQTTPGEFCPSCGADPKTGYRPGSERIRQCPSCRAWSAAYQERCSKCNREFPGVRLRRGLRKVAELPVLALRAAVFVVALGIILFSGVVILHAVSGGGGWLFAGEEARVQRTVRELVAALEAGDVMGAAGRMQLNGRSGEEAHEVALKLAEEIFVPVRPGPGPVRVAVGSVQVEGAEARAVVQAEFDGPGSPGVRTVDLKLKRTDGRWLVVP